MAGARSNEILYQNPKLNSEGPFTGVVIHLTPDDVVFLEKNKFPHILLDVRNPLAESGFVTRDCTAYIVHSDGEITPFDSSQYNFAKQIADLINRRKANQLEYTPEIGYRIKS